MHVKGRSDSLLLYDLSLYSMIFYKIIFSKNKEFITVIIYTKIKMLLIISIVW